MDDGGIPLRLDLQEHPTTFPTQVGAAGAVHWPGARWSVQQIAPGNLAVEKNIRDTYVFLTVSIRSSTTGREQPCRAVARPDPWKSRRYLAILPDEACPFVYESFAAQPRASERPYFFASIVTGFSQHLRYCKQDARTDKTNPRSTDTTDARESQRK
jgi:hypothetical protein